MRISHIALLAAVLLVGCASSQPEVTRIAGVEFVPLAERVERACLDSPIVQAAGGACPNLVPQLEDPQIFEDNKSFGLAGAFDAPVGSSGDLTEGHFAMMVRSSDIPAATCPDATAVDDRRFDRIGVLVVDCPLDMSEMKAVRGEGIYSGHRVASWRIDTSRIEVSYHGFTGENLDLLWTTICDGGLNDCEP